MSGPAQSGRPFRRLLGRWEARDVAPVVSLAVLVVFFLVAVPDFRRLSTISSVLTQGSVLAIVSVGMTFVLLCAEIDLSVGTVALWAACVCGWLFEHWVGGLAGEPEAPWWLIAAVVTLPLVSALGLGLVCGGLTVWSRLPSFIISLAMMFIAEGWSKYITQGQQFKIPGLLRTIGNDGFRLLGLRVPYSAVLAGVLLALGHVVLQHTRFGRYVYMTGGNREAARLAGVRTGLIVLACLALCAVTAAVGGLVNSGRMTNVTIDQNKDLLLSAVACVVLGGTSLFGGEGGMGKTVIGVLTFTVLSVGLMQVAWIPDLARQLLTGVVLMVALVINGVLAKQP
jgi:ribose transport system permease protein